MTKAETLKRYILFIIGLFFIAMGVAFTKHAELGVSPISSVANILSYKFTFMSMGSWLTFTNCLMILGQIVLLRKNFKLIQLLQLPLSFLFGFFTDVCLSVISMINTDAYATQITLVLVGVVVLAFGISLTVIANVIMNSGEAFVKALADVICKGFGDVKTAFDVSWVALSIVLSLIFFDFRIVGTREGTIISAVCTGLVVKFFNKFLAQPLNRYLSK
ncbi:MAG: YitT family protein [Clostridia bacterium]|nr:YitT family protein [Clostridia bacterium]